MATSRTKKILASLAIGATIVTAGVVSYRSGRIAVRICTEQKCRTLTAREYRAEKARLADKLVKEEPFTVGDWKLASAILDREIRLKGGVTYHGGFEGSDLKNELIKLLRD